MLAPYGTVLFLWC